MTPGTWPHVPGVSTVISIKTFLIKTLHLFQWVPQSFLSFLQTCDQCKLDEHGIVALLGVGLHVVCAWVSLIQVTLDGVQGYVR